MRQQDALGLVRTVSLDRVRSRERLDIEVLGEIRDDSAENTQGQLGTLGDAVLELDTCGLSDNPRLQIIQVSDRGGGEPTFSGDALCWGSENAAFSRATVDQRSEMPKGRMFGAKGNGRISWMRFSLPLSLSSLRLELMVRWSSANSSSASSSSMAASSSNWSSGCLAEAMSTAAAVPQQNFFSQVRFKGLRTCRLREAVLSEFGWTRDQPDRGRGTRAWVAGKECRGTADERAEVMLVWVQQERGKGIDAVVKVRQLVKVSRRCLT